MVCDASSIWQILVCAEALAAGVTFRQDDTCDNGSPECVPEACDLVWEEEYLRSFYARFYCQKTL